MSNYNQLVEWVYPYRVLKYLRKNFETAILAYSGGSDSTLLLLISLDDKTYFDHIVHYNTKLVLKMLDLNKLADWMEHEVKYCDKLIADNQELPEVLEFFSGRRTALLQFSETARIWSRINEGRKEG